MNRRIAAAALLLLAGCQLAPRHERPRLPTARSYPEESAGERGGAPPAELGWRDFFADPRLELLVRTALEKNRDLREAVYRIEEARGIFRIQRAERLPAVDLGADASRSRIPGGSFETGGAGGGTVERYSLEVRVFSFELDFWGRVRNLAEAARSEYLATVEAQRAFRLSLIRDVASAYFFLREAEERIGLAEATVASRREGLRIAADRLEAGVTSALDYRQSESLLTQAETELENLRLLRAESENLLTLLVGAPIDEPLPAPLPLAKEPGGTPLLAGLPSDLLVNRPDILAAEERLRAARADIGVARAAFLPRIALTGSLGYASTELDDLLRSDSEAWSFGPSVTLPLFDFGARRGNLTVAQARENIAVAAYERTVQTAFREVADALAGRRYLARQVAAQERNVETLRHIAELARLRYREGVVGYLEVLDAERSLFAADQLLLQVRRAEAENLVDLYVALGGGSME